MALPSTARTPGSWRLACGFTILFLVCIITSNGSLSQWHERGRTGTSTPLDARAWKLQVRRQIIENVPEDTIARSIEKSISIIATTENQAELDTLSEFVTKAIHDPSSIVSVSHALPYIYEVLEGANAKKRAALVKVLEEISRRSLEEAKKTGPKLVVSENEPTFQDTLANLLVEFGRPAATIVVDDYNYENLRDSVLLRDGRSPLIHVLTNTPEEAAKLAKNKDFRERPTVICMGGGAVLDVCKAAALGGKKELVLLPTIMSNACPSNNRSVLGLGTISFQTSVPSRVVFNIDALVSDDPPVVKQWTRAGVVEFLVTLVGGIDNQYQHVQTCRGSEEMDLKTILKSMPTAKQVFDALPWFDASFTGNFDRDAMMQIMKYVHETGKMVVEKGSNGHRIGGEHGFYRALMRIKPALRNSITHGEIVSLGVLLTLKIYAIQWGDDSLYTTFRKIFDKMDMPLTYSRFESKGLTRTWMLQALEEVGRSEGSGQYIMVDCVDTNHVGEVLDEILQDFSVDLYSN